MACSSAKYINFQGEKYDVVAQNEIETPLAKMIVPYRDSMQAEMNEILAMAPQNMLISRPSGSLNNWVADAVQDFAKKYVPDTNNYFTLLNFGGLRTVLDSGAITIGDIYRLMPFDNLVVLVEIDVSNLAEIEAYLQKSGGEPIAGAQLINGKFAMNTQAKTIWIATSDYLANGGDKMNFFKNPIRTIQTDILMRDVLLKAAKIQGVLKVDNSVRIGL